MPWNSSVSVFVIERMAIIHSLKCTVPFSFVVPILSLSVTHCHLLSLVATRCTTRCHSLSLVVPLAVTRYTTFCHSLSLAVTSCTTRCHSLYHSLSFVVSRCTTRCHSLSLDVPLVCLFINDHNDWRMQITEITLFVKINIFSILCKTAHQKFK